MWFWHCNSIFAVASSLSWDNAVICCLCRSCTSSDSSECCCLSSLIDSRLWAFSSSIHILWAVFCSSILTAWFPVRYSILSFVCSFKSSISFSIFMIDSCNWSIASLSFRIESIVMAFLCVAMLLSTLCLWSSSTASISIRSCSRACIADSSAALFSNCDSNSLDLSSDSDKARSILILASWRIFTASIIAYFSSIDFWYFSCKAAWSLSVVLPISQTAFEVSNCDRIDLYSSIATVFFSIHICKSAYFCFRCWWVSRSIISSFILIFNSLFSWKTRSYADFGMLSYVIIWWSFSISASCSVIRSAFSSMSPRRFKINSVATSYFSVMVLSRTSCNFVAFSILIRSDSNNLWEFFSSLIRSLCSWDLRLDASYWLVINSSWRLFDSSCWSETNLATSKFFISSVNSDLQSFNSPANCLTVLSRALLSLRALCSSALLVASLSSYITRDCLKFKKSAE